MDLLTLIYFIFHDSLSFYSTASTQAEPEEVAKSNESSDHKRLITSEDEEVKEDRRKTAIEEHAKYSAMLSKLKYEAPPGAAPFDPRYSFEVLKNGAIVDQIKFKPERSFYVIGRNTQ